MPDAPRPDDPPTETYVAADDVAPAAPPPADAPPVARRAPGLGTVGRYQLRAVLGRGGFGVVYRALDTTLHREVALKVPHARPGHAPLADRFVQEARAAAGLKHPHIVTVYDCGTDGDRPFIALELIDGVPLSQRIAGRLPSFRVAAGWVRDLALALHHAHDTGVLHRDVKPANVLVDKQDKVRLTDFGLAKLDPDAAGGPADSDDQVVTREGAVMGTPGYMSPEQARGEAVAVGPASDQYALGVVLYELLTGRRPYEGPAHKVIAETAALAARPPHPTTFDPDVPRELAAVALKALQKNPWDRYGSLADVAVDLQRWLNGDPVSAAPRAARAAAGVPAGPPDDWVKACPECGRWSKADRQRCMYCDHGLSRVPARDPRELLEPRRRPLLEIDDGPALPEGATPPAMRRVRAGLGCHLARLVLYVLTILALIGGLFVSAAVGLPADPYGPPGEPKGRLLETVVVGAAVALALATQALGLLGSTLCRAVPRESRARWLVSASLVLDLLGVWVQAWPFYVAEVGLAEDPAPWLTAFAPVVSAGLGLVAWLLFMNFLARLADYLGDEDTWAEALRIARRGVVLLVAPPAALAGLALLAGPVAGPDFVGCVAAVIGIGWAVMGIQLLVRYMGVLGTLREGIRVRVARADKQRLVKGARPAS